MVKQTQIGGVYVGYMSGYLTGTAAACGTVSTALTIPTGATSAWIHAEGGAIYWSVNEASAGTVSGGYVAQDNVAYIPPIDNMGTVNVIGVVAGAVAHVEFYQD